MSLLSFKFAQFSLYTRFYCAVRHIRANPGAKSGHDVPVGYIDQHTFNKRPRPTHTRFNRMDGAQAFPKYTVNVFTLGQHRLFPRRLAVTLNKMLWIRMQISGYSLNIFSADKGPSISLATITTLLAFKNVGRFHSPINIS